MNDTDIDAGRLTKRMALEQDIGTETDSTGKKIENWQPYGTPSTRWVAVRQLSGREIERAAMLQVEATHEIEMYWLAGLSAVKFRGKLGSRVFNFGIVNNVNEANIKLLITACEQIG